MSVHDPNFGASPHLLPNYKFNCPACKRSILIYRERPILPAELATTFIELRCQTPPCQWTGTLRGEDAYPYPVPDGANE